MTLIVIPVKKLREAKRRLAPILGAEGRARLTLAMLRDELEVLKRELGLDCLVVSADRVVRRTAEEYGVYTLDDGGLGLNEALTLSASWASTRGFKALTVVPVDLPLIEPEDIGGALTLVEAGGRVAVLTPCRRMNGTNLLGLNPPGRFRFSFGFMSFKAHVEEAERAGMDLYLYLSDRLSIDLDTVEDLREVYPRLRRGSYTSRFLRGVEASILHL